MGTPIYGQLVRRTGDPDWRLASEVGTGLWDGTLNLRVCANPRQRVSELSHTVGHPVRIRQELENCSVWRNTRIWCQTCRVYRKTVFLLVLGEVCGGT